MEDFNTCTLPHEKYINLEKWEMAEFNRKCGNHAMSRLVYLRRHVVTSCDTYLCSSGALERIHSPPPHASCCYFCLLCRSTTLPFSRQMNNPARTQVFYFR